jgi:adenosylcobinamide-phosphate synthase
MQPTVSLGLLAAYAIDLAFGEPPDSIHPVAWVGTAVAAGRAWALRPGKAEQLVRGGLVALAIPTVAAALAHGVTLAVGRSPVAVFLSTVLVLKPTFAVRGLRDAAYVVRDALQLGDMEGARLGLRSLCSRPADDLDPEALVAATLESVAENASDSVVAPLFFFACFGLPGAVFYRTANTLDAMMGYHGRLEYAGKAAARLDDLLNLVPARITACLLLAAGALVGADAKRGLEILRRDGAKTESPNAGRPMAAMAGLLGVRLSKKGHYDLGDRYRALDPERITRAWHIASVAAVIAFGVTALFS